MEKWNLEVYFAHFAGPNGYFGQHLFGLCQTRDLIKPNSAATLIVNARFLANFCRAQNDLLKLLRT